MKEGHLRSLSKATGWRVIGILFLGLITYIFTEHWILTTAITLSHHAAFIVLYYLHERLWNWTSWLRDSAIRPIARIILYETIMGTLVLGLISYAFIGEWPKVTAITLIYIANKHWMYYLHDILWGKWKWMVKE